MNSKVVSLLKVTIVILILTAVLQILLPAMNSNSFVSFIERIGLLGPLIVIAYTVISHVIAPVAGSPGVVLGFTVYGVYWGSLYLYIASLISAVINFWIARKFGRKWVIKLVGNKSMSEVDQFVNVTGTKVLILARVFGFSLFEFISYAAGLTKISFSKYIIVTALFSSIPNLIFIFFFQNIDFESQTGFILWLGSLIITGVLFSIFFRRFVTQLK